ncbi:MAG: HAD-IIIC family phosphatase [Synergistaceae bacterium]|nr:HAD-IIIC family phosphatase [Synergistaceae bacterium]
MKKEISGIISNLLNINQEEIDKINDDTNLIDYGLTSILFIKLIVSLENAFKIEFNDSDLVMSKFETVNNILDIVERYCNNSSNKKAIICDCDGVLWQGESGEGTIYVGESQNKFQETIKKLYNKGVLICLCSKNQETNVISGLNNPNVILDESIFLTIKTNCNNKAASVLEIANEFGLQTESIVFLDDSDYELELIKLLLPEVMTIKIDYEDQNIFEKIEHCFSSVSVLGSQRTEQYKQQKNREKERLNFFSIDEYNEYLHTIVNIYESKQEEIERISELSFRTNQFNLSCRKYKVSEINSFIHSKKYDVISLSVSDEFGDMGLVGCAIINKSNENIIIENIFISCRILNRNIENRFVEAIKTRYGNNKIYGIYKASQQNKKYNSFYETNGVLKYEQV